MNALLWVLQVAGALLFAASGSMKVFMLEKVSHDVASFGALPRSVWKALGVVELVCTVGLILPAVLHWQPQVTVLAAAILAGETLIFVWVHVNYREAAPIVFSSLLGLLMAFLAYGRAALAPLG